MKQYQVIYTNTEGGPQASPLIKAKNKAEALARIKTLEGERFGKHVHTLTLKG